MTCRYRLGAVVLKRWATVGPAPSPSPSRTQPGLVRQSRRQFWVGGPNLGLQVRQELLGNCATWPGHSRQPKRAKIIGQELICPAATSQTATLSEQQPLLLSVC